MTPQIIKLAAVLLLVLFIAACSRRTDPPQNTHDTNAPPPPPRQYFADNSEAPTEQEPRVGGLHQPINFNGRVITVGMLQEGSLPFTMLPSSHNEPDPATSGNYVRDRMIWDNARRVEYVFNFSIESFIPRGPAHFMSLLRTSVAAGNPFADIVLAPPEMSLEAAVNNLIQPLDMINLPGSDLLGLQIYSRFVAEGFGHAWAFSTTEPETAAFTLGVNLDVIHAAGAPNPVDLYNSGHWTWDTMLEIMRMTTLDTTGDGTIDQWGIAEFVNIAGTGGLRRIQQCDLLRNFIGANDGMLVTEDLNYGLDHPNSIEAMAFVETILQEGLLRPNVRWSGSGSSITFSFITDGNFAFMVGTPLEGSYGVMRASHLPFDFAVIPLPTGPSNTSGNTWLGGWQQGLVLPWGSSWEAAELLMVMEEYFSWAGNEPERINDIPILWANSVILSGEDAARQLDAMHTMRLDLGSNIAGVMGEMDAIVNNFIPHPHPNLLWHNRTAQEAAVDFREPMQRELDRFFR